MMINLKESIEYFKRNSLMVRAPSEIDDKTRHSEIIIQAAKDLLEIIRAREGATAGEWSLDDGFIVNDKETILGSIDDDLGAFLNNKFTIKAANTCRKYECIKCEKLTIKIEEIE